jgi:RNA polymerase-binding transcription factor DksA
MTGLQREPEMSRFESEAKRLLLKRRDSLHHGPAGVRPSDPTASWADWESQQELLAETKSRELADIEAALRRIEEGNYGRCESCGGPLGLQRMRAIPEARFCVSCSGSREEVD